MNQATSLATNSPAWSSQMPNGVGPRPWIIASCKGTWRPPITSVVSAATSSRALPEGSSAAARCGRDRRCLASSQSSYGVPPM
jgi:hypothetical protein